MVKIFYLSLFFSLAISCTLKQQGFEIDGTIQNSDKAKAKLYEYRYNTGWFLIDSSEVKNNKFTFQGQVDIPTPMYIKVDNIIGYGFVFVQNSNINIEVINQDLFNLKVTGSDCHIKYEEYKKIENELFNSLKDSMQVDYDIAKVKQDQPLMDSILLELEKVDIKIKEHIINYIKNNKKSPISPYIVSNSPQRHLFSKKDLEVVLETLDISLKESYDVKDLQSFYDGLINREIGSSIKHFTINDTSGNLISTSKLDGQYWLLDFWSSRCGPCRKENPKLEKIYNKYKSKGFEIIGVSFDSKKEDWVKAIKEDGISWIQVSDLNGWANQAKILYSIEYLPQSLLIDRNGKIIASNLKSESLEEKLNSLYRSN